MHFHYSCELFKCHKELFNLPTLPTIINWHWLGWGIAERNSLRKEKQLAAPQCRSDSAAARRIDLATLRTSRALSGRLTHCWEFGRHDASSLCLVFSVLFLSPPSIISVPLFWFNWADARHDRSAAAAERRVFPFCNGRVSKFSIVWLLQLPVEEPVIHVKDANWSLRESLCNTETVEPSPVCSSSSKIQLGANTMEECLCAHQWRCQRCVFSRRSVLACFSDFRESLDGWGVRAGTFLKSSPLTRANGWISFSFFCKLLL